MSDKISTGASENVEVKEGNESIHAQGCADDGSNDLIVSSHIAEKAVLNGVGKLSIISPVAPQVALKSGTATESAKRFRAWTSHRLVLILSAGAFGLLDVRCFY